MDLGLCRVPGEVRPQQHPRSMTFPKQEPPVFFSRLRTQEQKNLRRRACRLEHSY